FNDRSGMSSSTRKKAIQLWQTDIPVGDKEILAKTLFSFENPPGTKIISGSQDSIGIVFPGVNKLNYSKENYWPDSIESENNNEILEFIEKHLYFISLSPRIGDFDVLANTNINRPNAQNLADAANNCWKAIENQNLQNFGKAMREAFEAQIAMFPNMVNPAIFEMLEPYKKEAIGWKLSGAGGGGYLILVSENPIPNAIQIRIVR
ncbi:MAG: cytidyltransferase, partial [Bacteroidales bacterium]|nr:cytidyltransferase [Bacteroidales bacterium]